MSVGRVGSPPPDGQQLVFHNPGNEQFSQLPESQLSDNEAQGSLDSQNGSQDPPVEPSIDPGATSDNSQED